MSKKSSYNANDVAKYLTGAPDFINLYISDLEKQISNLSNIGLAPVSYTHLTLPTNREV